MHVPPDSPMSSVAPTEWARPESEVQPVDRFIANTHANIETLVRPFGGPGQYLRAHLQDLSELKLFAQWLWDTFPEKDEVFYHHSAEIPPVAENDIGTTAPTALHLTALGFDTDASHKPPPGMSLFSMLMEQILRDGFITSSEPLLVLQSRPAETIPLLPAYGHYGGDMKLKTFSVSYMKGCARVSTLMAILHALWKNGVDLETEHNVLFKSLQTIYVHHTQQSNVVDEALQNMKFSSRGSLRKMTNVVQLVFMMKKLQAKGLLDPSVYIRKWNQMSAKGHQITGKKAMCTKLLMESAPKQTLDRILDHVGDFGWETSCWTEETLASKKLYPGYQFPYGRSKKWQPRVRTTEDSTDLAVRRAHATFAQLPTYMRKSFDPTEIDGLSERAACVSAFAKELLLVIPIKENLVKTQFVESWASGNDHIDVEIRNAIDSKAEAFDVAELPFLKRLVNSHITSAPIDITSGAKDALVVDDFNLLMKKLHYDVQVFEVWQQKCVGVHAAIHHKKLEHAMTARHKTRQAANALFEAHCKLFLWEGNTSEQLIGQILNWRNNQVIAKLGCVPSKVPYLVALNWACPCLIPSQTQDQQLAILSWALHDNMQSSALVVAPVFSYNVGKLHLEEQKMVTALSRGNHNLDVHFNVIFKDQCDSRDLRPMVYPGRLVFPSPLMNIARSMWFSCDLRRMRRTEEVPQLPPKLMKEVEDLAADALPTSMDGKDSHIHGASKYCQLGVGGWQAILHSTFTGVTWENASATIVVDLYPRVGDLLESFFAQRQIITSVALFYIAFCENQTELDWLSRTAEEFMANKFWDGEWQLPASLGVLSKELPSDLVDPLPPVPSMNVLIISGTDGKKTLNLPVSIVKEWHTHPTFGMQFNAWLDNFVEKYNVLDPASEPGPAKRPGPGKPPGLPPFKKAKVTPPENIFDANDITEALIQEAKVVGLGKECPWLQLRVGHRIYLVNKSMQEISVPDGSYLAGFGKGAFKLAKLEGSESPPGAIAFKLESQDNWVVLSGNRVRIGDVMADQRKTKPDAELCYHKSDVDSTDPTQFSLTMTHRVLFLPKDDSSSEVTTNNIATKEELQYWMSEQMEVLWVVRWTAKGLMPVKPVVHIREACVLPPGRATALGVPKAV